MLVSFLRDAFISLDNIFASALRRLVKRAPGLPLTTDKQKTRKASLFGKSIWRLRYARTHARADTHAHTHRLGTLFLLAHFRGPGNYSLREFLFHRVGYQHWGPRAAGAGCYLSTGSQFRNLPQPAGSRKETASGRCAMTKCSSRTSSLTAKKIQGDGVLGRIMYLVIRLFPVPLWLRETIRRQSQSFCSVRGRAADKKGRETFACPLTRTGASGHSLLRSVHLSRCSAFLIFRCWYRCRPHHLSFFIYNILMLFSVFFLVFIFLRTRAHYHGHRAELVR